jgi:hypothetical protein
MINPTTVKTIFLIVKELVILIRELAEIWDKDEQKDETDGKEI